MSGVDPERSGAEAAPRPFPSRRFGKREPVLDEAGPAGVVIGLDCITGLQTARTLASHGIPVVGIVDDLDHFSCRSRIPRRIIRGETGSHPLVGVLEDLAAELHHPAVLFPCTDASVLAVAQHRSELEPRFRVALPEWEVLSTLADKRRFHSFASAAGFPLPRTFLLLCRREAEEAAETLAFPCILKPSLRTATWQRNSPDKVLWVSTPEELLELFDRCSRWTEALIVQEWIEGPDSELYSCNCYIGIDGRSVATFVARKIRQWPPGAGTSSLGEECRNDEVRDLTLNLFQSVPFHGLGYLEVKRDSRTGEHIVIEANVGRPTGRSAIAEAGGVELVYAMYCDALGRPLPGQLEQRYGNARWIFWRQDARAAFHYWRRGELTLRDWVGSWRGKKATAVFSWRDPGPFFADIARTPRRLLKGGRRRPRPVTDGWDRSEPVEVEGVPNANS